MYLEAVGLPSTTKMGTRLKENDPDVRSRREGVEIAMLISHLVSCHVRVARKAVLALSFPCPRSDPRRSYQVLLSRLDHQLTASPQA